MGVGARLLGLLGRGRRVAHSSRRAGGGPRVVLYSFPREEEQKKKHFRALPAKVLLRRVARENKTAHTPAAVPCPADTQTLLVQGSSTQDNPRPLETPPAGRDLGGAGRAIHPGYALVTKLPPIDVLLLYVWVLNH